MVSRALATVREIISRPMPEPLSITRTIGSWWSETRTRHSFSSVTRQLLSKLWEFVRDSTPHRKKQRYGDADYDWERRVNTTSATVNWRDRLLGLFLSPYQPTEPTLFHEMLDALQLDFSQFTFIDIGSGKGRTLLMASDYSFKQILGVEIIPELHAAAVSNIAAYKSEAQKTFAIESRCEDARSFAFPEAPLLVYLFNPLPEQGLKRLLERLQKHIGPVYILYHNPEWHALFSQPAWKKVGGTHQYSVFQHLSEGSGK